MDIDQDVFQVIALALLFLTLIALLATLATLSGIKKSLSRGDSPSTTTSAYSTPATSYAETQPAYGGTGAYTGGGYGGEPAAASQEVATGYVPLSQATQAAQPAEQTSAATPASTGSTLTGAEPEEQPFERDGRWWFKRGDELLVYDEGTGQWVAAGVPSPAAGTDAPGATTTSFPTTGGDTGEGWRCSSCGAINGSTATVCRMCFTPR